ncbi:hypothetical protein DSO57_1012274 [Entomophthora muscae]|uniref:Uncharacterized protein n=1 Tax=Entomophthora muscae TaxID=34485 RepID=A0ACC2TTT5_9FUNG|nr:hypothetical protein DSO57_1012274 [Entomophthora muscae]
MNAPCNSYSRCANPHCLAANATFLLNKKQLAHICQHLGFKLHIYSEMKLLRRAVVAMTSGGEIPPNSQNQSDRCQYFHVIHCPHNDFRAPLAHPFVPNASICSQSDAPSGRIQVISECLFDHLDSPLPPKLLPYITCRAMRTLQTAIPAYDMAKSSKLMDGYHYSTKTDPVITILQSAGYILHAEIN